MSSFRSILILSIACIFHACKTPVYTFSPEAVVNEEMEKNISLLLGAKHVDTITEVRRYQAIIREQLVNNNAVADYKLMNSLSQKPQLGVQSDRYTNKLYFYEMRSVNEQLYGILFTATFFVDTCIGVGPMYIGFRGPGASWMEFRTAVEYSFGKKRDGTIRRRKGKPNADLLFAYRSSGESVPRFLNFFQILYEGGNKVSGMTKPMVYDVPVIFNDSNALKFMLIPK